MSVSVIPIVTLWEEFTKNNNSIDPIEFGKWLIKRDSYIESSFAINETKSKLNNDIGLSSIGKEAQIMLLISRLQRIMQLLAKPIIRSFGFTKDHEYSMLTHTYLLKTPNKKQLAQEMLLETSTAVEISNRLLSKGLIEPIDNESDKRSTRIGITDKGKKVLFDSYQVMKQLPEHFLQDLTGDQKDILLTILLKIEKINAPSF